jgi:hypothetical protein
VLAHDDRVTHSPVTPTAFWMQTAVFGLSNPQSASRTWWGERVGRGLARDKGAVEDGDGMPGQVYPIAVDGGVDYAGACGGLQSGEAVPAQPV